MRDEGSAPMARGRIGFVGRATPWIDRAALASLLIVLALAAIYLTSIWWERWYHNDAWAYLQRDWSLDGLLRPHAGHPVPLNVSATLLGRALFGFEVAPMFPVLRAISWVGYLATLSVVLTRLGVEKTTTLIFVCLLAVWPLAVWQEGWLLGNPVVHAAALVIGFVVATNQSPSPRVKFGVALAAAAIVVNMSSGTILAFSIVAAILVTGKARMWLPAIISVPATYAIWRIAYSGSAAEIPADFGAILQVPAHWARLLVAATGATTGLPDILATLLVLTAGAMVAIGMWRRRSMSPLEAMLLLASFAYVGAVLVFRIDPGLAEPLALRYQYNVFLLFLPVALPHIRIPEPVGLVVLLGALVFVVPSLVTLSGARNDFWIERTAAERRLLATEAHLIEDGEPYLPNTALGAQPLRARNLVELMSMGLTASLGAPDPEETPRARGQLQLLLTPSGENRPEDCGQALSLRLRPGQHALVSAPGGEASFETSSEGEAVLPLPANRRTYSITPLFDEPSELIRIMGDDVCGVVSE